MRAEWHRVLQPRYVAHLAPHIIYEIVEIPERHSLRPDVSVGQPRPPSRDQGNAVAIMTARPVESAVEMDVPLRLYTVEVHDTDTMRLGTAIELLSPVNKRPRLAALVLPRNIATMKATEPCKPNSSYAR
jgi:hypothetical protein